MDAMDRFVNRKNIDRYRRLANKSTDAAGRVQILGFLAEEEAKFALDKSELGHNPETTLREDDRPSTRES
jgi:hypothetical protein